MFRVTVNPEGQNQNAARLGDRVLTAWVGTAEGGILHFPTYTYTDLNGNGNANYFKNIPHKNRHVNWHFVYFAYSNQDRKARVYVKFLDSEEE